jgi:hypothetical protein
VTLAKRWLWLPDDGLCKPKYVGAVFIILIALIVYQSNVICVHYLD